MCGFTPKWGILTGVRPSKLIVKRISQYDEDNARDWFLNTYKVSPEKTELAIKVAKTELKIIEKAGEKSFSLYISIPFCPTRCSYCSFVSHSINSEKAKSLIPDYIEKLLEELGDETNRKAKFVTNIAFIFPDGREIVTQGEVQGRILSEPAGNNGFGYDPLFISELGSFGEISGEEKDSISHRGVALKDFAIKLATYLKEV